MFGKKKGTKVKKSSKFFKFLPSLLTIIFVLIIFCIIIIPKCQLFSKEFQEYSTLLDELEVTINDEDMSSHILKDEDNIIFENKFLEFVHNPSNPIFENNHFIYENVLPENIEFLENELVLNNENLGRFLNEMLNSGLVQTLYDNQNKKSIVKILELKTLKTTDNKTTIEVICKIDIKSLIATYSSTKAMSQDILKHLPEKLYFVFNTTFSNNTILNSKMQINKLSEKSNNLFLSMLFGDWKDNNNNSVLKSLNNITKFFLEKLDTAKTMWDVSCEFYDESFKFVKND